MRTTLDKCLTRRSFLLAGGAGLLAAVPLVHAGLGAASGSHEVFLSASDGDVALSIMETTAVVDLVITDVIMPGIDGVELAERVRQRWPATRVLFMSGFAGDRLTARGIGDNDELLLQKPFALRDLSDRVRALLDKPR